MISFKEESDLAKIYAKRLNDLKTAICAKHEYCSDCPLYGYEDNDLDDICWNIYKFHRALIREG